MITKNKTEIEKILKEIEELKKDDLSCQFTAQYDEEIETLKKILQATIKTSIQWCEDEIEFLKVLDKHCRKKELLIINEVDDKLQHLQSHLKWLNEKEKEI